MTTSKAPFTWHVDIDCRIQNEAKMAALKKNMDVREYVSIAIQKALNNEGEK